MAVVAKDAELPYFDHREEGGSRNCGCDPRGGNKGRGWEAGDNHRLPGSCDGGGGNRQQQQQRVLCFYRTTKGAAGDAEGL